MTSDTEYAAVRTYLRGRFRSLEGPGAPSLAQLDTLPSGSAREEFAAASPLPEAVNAFLCEMDAKLDAVLAAMTASSLDEDFPHAMDVLALGASGMDFTSAEPLAPGDWIEVIIPFRSGRAFTAAGIGSVTGRRENADGTPVFTFSFSRILEEEREKIIRFVFKEERRLLRETRLEQK